MVTDASVYLGDAILGWIKSTAMPSDPANVYATLHSGDPAGSSANEITGSINLTRQAISWGSISARAMSNNADIAFGTANSTGSVTYVAIYDSVTAGMGNEICKKSISSASITNGLAVKILSGNLVLSY